MTKARHPRRQFFGQMMQTTLGGMISIRDIQNCVLDTDGYAGRRVLGYKLPVWQRPEVWTDEQCVRFLESIWMGVGLGTFMVNYSGSGVDDDTHLILLDGQQRMRAIERYWGDELAVVGDDGLSYFWSQLEDGEQAHFFRIPFPWVCTQYSTDEQLREAYNRHNFGGVAHTTGQMA